MANNEPIIKFQAGGTPAYLSYDVAEPTSHYGQVAIDFGVADGYYVPPPPLPPSTALYDDLEMIRQAMRSGFASTEYFPGIGIQPNWITFVDTSDDWHYQTYSEFYPNLRGDKFVGIIAVGKHGYDPDIKAYIGRWSGNWGKYARSGGDPFISQALAGLTPELMQAQLKAGNRLSVFTDGTGRYDCKWVPNDRTVLPKPRMVLLEKYRFSNHLGNYGTGRVLQTFSLLPGEKTKITVKSYSRSSSTTKSTSSIFDSYSQDSAEDFANAVGAEHSDKRDKKESLSWHVEAEAEVNYGFVAAKVSAGYKGGTNSAREQFGKEVSNAAQKHSAKVSSKRDVRVDQTEETRLEAGEESGIEREIQNINTGRTLNFVFRQMNQEFINILHLVDIEIGYTNGFPGNLQRFPIAQLDKALEYIKNEDDAQLQGDQGGPSRNKREVVRQKILGELGNIIDYAGNLRQIIERRSITKVGDVETFYYRVKNDQTASYVSPTGKKVEVQGIIISAGTAVMRTAGVMVEALLGQGEGLDDYSKTLQREEGRTKKAQNDLEAARVQRKNMVAGLASSGDAAAARLYAMLYPTESPPALPGASGTKGSG